ncbi:MAG: hypothetical protein LQ338_007630 [Usnochroma carphineum]|nr:MAG: hypothetical protein LQ338_007630 [Usnochroma carphineum]
MESQAHSVSQDGRAGQHISLLDLSPEILDKIFEETAIQHRAALALVSKSMKAYVEPHLYHKIYTEIGTPHDTAGLVRLLHKRPEILPFVKTLVLDEYHPRHTRQLLAIRMPNLWCLLIQHEGKQPEPVSDREKRALNRDLKEQPALDNFVFWTATPFTLSKEDACLFRHPNVTRFRFSFVLSLDFEDVDKSYFINQNLKILSIEESKYSPEALERLVAPSKCLTSVSLWDPNRLPFEEIHLLPILSHAVETLKVLKLKGCYCASTRTSSFDLTKFKALRLLHISPLLLFGPCTDNLGTYTSHNEPDLAQLIRNRLPPNLKMLLLDGLTDIRSLRPGFEERLLVRDYDLMHCLLEQKAFVAPKLRHLFLYTMQAMVGPEWLYELAGQVGVQMCELYSTDDIDPNWEILDKDEA